MTFEINKESELFHLKMKPSSLNESANNETRNWSEKKPLDSSGDRDRDYVVRLRKTEVVIEGEKRIIVMIRDFTDSINFEKN